MILIQLRQGLDLEVQLSLAGVLRSVRPHLLVHPLQHLLAQRLAQLEEQQVCLVEEVEEMPALVHLHNKAQHLQDLVGEVFLVELLNLSSNNNNLFLDPLSLNNKQNLHLVVILPFQAGANDLSLTFLN